MCCHKKGGHFTPKTLMREEPAFNSFKTLTFSPIDKMGVLHKIC